jgi:hypothetical protein
MFYLIELSKPPGNPAYVVEQAETGDRARALVDARLSREDADDEITIVAVHPVQ